MHKNLSNYAEKGGSNVCEPPFKILDLLNLLDLDLQMCLIFGDEIKGLLNILLPFKYRKGMRWDLNSGDRTTTKSCYSTGG
jgi:hypothetical protein